MCCSIWLRRTCRAGGTGGSFHKPIYILSLLSRANLSSLHSRCSAGLVPGRESRGGCRLRLRPGYLHTLLCCSQLQRCALMIPLPNNCIRFPAFRGDRTYFPVVGHFFYWESSPIRFVVGAGCPRQARGLLSLPGPGRQVMHPR